MSTLSATRDMASGSGALRRDPAPSKMNYRLQRLWLRKYVQPVVRFWVPFIGVILAGFMLFGNTGTRDAVLAKYSNIRDSIAARPELTITKIEIPVGSVDLVRQIDGVIDLSLPVSALDIDLEQIRQVVQNLSAVKSAVVQLGGNGTLSIRIEERVPRTVWRNGSRIFLLDDSGIKVAEIPRRSVRFDLPLIIGEGADRAISEALVLFEMARPIEERIRAMVRVGERRWNIVLDNDQTIMLPEFGAREALRMVMEMHSRQNMLGWNLSFVDLRDPARPIIRLNGAAIQELERQRNAAQGEPV